jgi:hypothetical protein
VLFNKQNTQTTISKEILELNNSMEKVELTDIYMVLNPTKTGYTFFSAPHETFCKIDHILNQKADLNNYKRFKKFPCILVDHNKIKLEINGKQSYRIVKIHGTRTIYF